MRSYESVSRRLRRLAAVLLVAHAGAVPLVAQTSAAGGGWNATFADSELENYLRYLQSEGIVPAHPWSIRGFGLAEIDRLVPRATRLPWSDQYPILPGSGAFDVAPIPLGADFVYNSAFPYGSNDGPVWAGRGITTVLTGGVSARWGPASLVIAPILFRAENAEFDLAERPDTLSPFADRRFTDYVHPLIDLPQRFGEDPVTRLDPGESTIRVDLPVVALGASTASQWWGPASEHPLVMGNNAGGFPHVFAGTSAPLNVGIGRVHGRVIWGRIHQSEFSPVQDEGTVRFASGMVAVFTPRGLPGLEIGGTRFFHQFWPEDGLGSEDVFRLFQAFLKERLPDVNEEEENPDLRKSDPQNQLASVFARWVFPGSGFEAYGEYAREDHSQDLRDFTLSPDHDAGYMLGVRKLWRASETTFVGLRGEVMNTRVRHLTRARIQMPFYTHGATRQGHTLRGQLLGSADAYGGAGSILALDYYHAAGRWSAAWSRGIREDDWSGLVRKAAGGAAVVPSGHSGRTDVYHSFGVDGLLFEGRLDISAGAAAVYNLNRNLEDDAFNLNASFGLRYRL
jgi:hypothetical protein